MADGKSEGRVPLGSDSGPMVPLAPASGPMVPLAPASGPMVPLAPGNYDRAWNDPPLFSYTESLTSQGSGQRLNKRIGFPARGLPSNAPAGCDPTAPPKLHDAGTRPPANSMPLPPPPATSTTHLGPPPLPPSVSSTLDRAGDSSSNQEVGKESICPVLRSLTSEFCGEKSQDVMKRLELLELGLDQGNYSSRLVTNLAQFVHNIQEGNTAPAEQRLTTLGADYAGDCAPWIVALRHILLAVRESQIPEKEPEPVTTPYFVPVSNQ